MDFKRLQHIQFQSLLNLWIIICLCGSCSVAESEQQKKDKIQIAQAIIDNIEFERLSLQNDSASFAQFDSVSRQIYHSATFARYADRRLRNSLDYSYYPQSVSTQMDVKISKIFYSKDSLKCAALIVLDIHFDILPEFEDPLSSHEYVGFAVYGVRKKIESPFKIYPISSLTVISRDSEVFVELALFRGFNTNAIKGCGTAGTYMEKRKHKYWFGHEKFFEDSPDFRTDSAGVFWCEYNYINGSIPTRKYLYSNRDSAVPCDDK